MTTLPQTAPVRLPRAVIPSHLAPAGPMVPGFAQQAPGQSSISAADVWRILRANFWLITCMVMASAVGGYFVNRYLATYHSRFTAVGLMTVRVSREVPVPGVEPVEASPPEIELAQNTQRNIIKHETLFTEATQDDASKIRQTGWFHQFDREPDPMAARKKDMEDHFDAVPIPNSRLLRVEMTYSDPEDAKTIVEEMVQRHIERVKRSQYDIETKKVDLLLREQKLVSIDLDDIKRQLADKELALGMDQVGTSLSWSGQQLQLDRMLSERQKISAEMAGIKSRYDTLTKDLGEGKTPAEVEKEINSSYWYLMTRQRVQDADVVLQLGIDRLGEHHEDVIRLKKQRALYQEQLDQTRDELKSTYSETMKSLLYNEIEAGQANFQRVEAAIDDISKKLGKLNDMMSEYRTLQERYRELQKKRNDLKEEADKITQLRINSPWATAEWASNPQRPDRPSFPKLPVTMSLAVLLGLSLSLGIAFLREMMDTTVRSPRDLARVGQLNLLGVIPHEADDPQCPGGRLQLSIFDAPHSMVAEQFRHVRSKLQHMASLDTTRTILVTSPSPGDGKSMVACNLAAALALNGRRVLLVDANFRRPQLHAVFNVDNDRGFADVLDNPELLDQTARETEVPNLVVLTTGARPASPTELMESRLFSDFVERATQEYDHVVFDGGPLLVVSEAVALAPRVDGVVTVVRARGNSRGLLMRMRDELRKIRAEHLGVILNAVRSQGGGYYGRNIKTYYAYQNG